MNWKKKIHDVGCREPQCWFLIDNNQANPELGMPVLNTNGGFHMITKTTITN
jgi:hypothetical protein